MKKRYEILGWILLGAFGAHAAEIHDSLWNAKESTDAGFTETPTQILGPFYPHKLPQKTSSDLTVVNGKKAIGIEIYVHGQVKNTDGVPLANAKVEIWQACQTGSYNHPDDTNPAPRDPNFEYYASVQTDSLGNYLFKTIIPGPYPAEDNWMRPSHIHFKVSHGHLMPLITQLYFDGNSFPQQVVSIVGGKPITGQVLNKLNELDLLFSKLPEPKHSKLLVPFQKQDGFDAPVGLFNIYLKTKVNTDL